MESGFPHYERRNSKFGNRANSKFNIPIHRKEGLIIQNEYKEVQKSG
jgi:hypothetical protein